MTMSSEFAAVIVPGNGETIATESRRVGAPCAPTVSAKPTTPSVDKATPMAANSRT